MTKSDYISNVLRSLANEVETTCYKADVDLETAHTLLLVTRTLRTIAEHMKPPVPYQLPPIAPEPNKSDNGGTKVPRVPVKPIKGPGTHAAIN